MPAQINKRGNNQISKRNFGKQW